MYDILINYIATLHGCHISFYLWVSWIHNHSTSVRFSRPSPYIFSTPSDTPWPSAWPPPELLPPVGQYAAEGGGGAGEADQPLGHVGDDRGGVATLDG